MNLIVAGEAPRTLHHNGVGDDIVHPLKKFEDKCNRSVVGSNPTRGAMYWRTKRAEKQGISGHS